MLAPIFRQTCPHPALVLIDGAVSDIPFLLTGVPAHHSTVVLPIELTGVQAIGAHLKTHYHATGQQAHSLHLVSHGRPGSLRWGQTELNLQTLWQHTTEDLIGN